MGTPMQCCQPGDTAHRLAALRLCDGQLLLCGNARILRAAQRLRLPLACPLQRRHILVRRLRTSPASLSKSNQVLVPKTQNIDNDL